MSDLDMPAKLQQLLRLPWTLRHEINAEEGYHVLRVAELPSVLATGATPQELEQDFWEAMRATLSSYLEDGEPVPAPQIPTLRLAPSPPETDTVIVSVTRVKDTWELQPPAATTAAESQPWQPNIVTA